MALVLVLAVGAQWLGWRLRLPALLFLLVIGFALGQWVTPDEIFGRKLLFDGVNLSVAIILFEGSLGLKLREVRDLGRPIFQLCTVTAGLAWVLITGAAMALGFDGRVSLLLGAILIVTGPTVINPILRQLRPTRRVSALLRWEGIVVDPLGAILALLVYQAITSIDGSSIGQGVLNLGLTLLVGLLFAGPIGWIVTAMMRRHLIPDFLQGVIFVGVAVGTCVGANVIREESGLVAVTMLGIYLANQRNLELEPVIEFKEHLQVLLVGVLFIMLAGRVTPSQILDILSAGLIFVALLVLVIRPASVLLGLVGTETTRQERTLMSFMAPRGIVAASVASIFAMQFSESADHVREQAKQIAASDPEHSKRLFSFANQIAGMASQVDRLVPLVFLVIVCTVAIYGLGIGRLAEKLGLASASPRGVMFAGSPAWTIDTAKTLRDLDVPTLIVTRRAYDLYAVRKAGLRCEAADFLSEYATEDMDLAGIASMVACTPDDDTNSIASVHYRRALGRANVFQLERMDERDDGDATTGTAQILKARTAFDPPTSHSAMDKMWRNGKRVRRVKLDENRNWEMFREAMPDAVVMFVVKPSSVNVATNGMSAPKEDDTIIYLGDEWKDAPEPVAAQEEQPRRQTMSVPSSEEAVRDRIDADRRAAEGKNKAAASATAGDPADTTVDHGDKGEKPEQTSEASGGVEDPVRPRFDELSPGRPSPVSADSPSEW
ncbi:sodium:proton antiporter [Cutibacterium acnes]|uniref:cation:proton antiporter n=1 Tax=Cutibacterium TaxID=1912216 RepID=UPI000203F639|nr:MULTISPECIES: sodium:proton antiporter [Cutibacterium]EGE76086.1 transporter, CPA2 family [Cutibacterium acnes HL097PA1]EIA11775.1 transporter, CPA2 family protein [Cutibacterium acnes PRP-38]MCA3768885.1 sodium:proton antiporter [Cutibacterium sp.]MDU4205739.1 sodium:proton antiporter [Cutibacterium acnes]REB12130.1 sodium:proton antiporter [Cutibacterium acnes]